MWRQLWKRFDEMVVEAVCSAVNETNDKLTVIEVC